MKKLFSVLITFLFASLALVAQEQIVVGLGAAATRNAINSNFDSLYSIRNTVYGKVYLPTSVTIDSVKTNTILLNGTSIQGLLDAKQATLVSGTNIKTINSTSILGSGDIVIEGGTGTGTGDMLVATYDTDENNIVDQAETAAAVTGLSLGTGSIATVGNDAITLTTTGDSPLTLPTSGTLASETKVGQMISDTMTQMFADAEPMFDLADSNVYDKGYATPTWVQTQLDQLRSTLNSAGFLVTSVNVASLSGATVIDTDGGSLDFEANVEPNTAIDTSLTWSYIAGTGTADFETAVGAPTLTALTDGTVTVRATANDGSGIYGEDVITISNQAVYTAAYQTLHDAFNTVPHDTIAAIYNAMVYSFDTLDFRGVGSVWDRFDWFLWFANHAENDALTDWTGNITVTNANSIPWALFEGYTGDGTNLLLTDWNPTTDAINYSLNSATIGAYIRTEIEEGGEILGAYSSGTGRTTMNPRGGTGGWSFGIRLNQGNNSDIFKDTPYSSLGLYIASRTAADNIDAYERGVYLGSDNEPSTSMPNQNLGIMGTYGLSGRTTHQVSCAFALDGVTAAEQEAIATIINTAMTALYKNVY